MDRLRGKRALITGGTSGIGLATARQFLAEGAQIALTGTNPVTIAAARAELDGDVTVIRAGIVTRGVLIDIPAHRGTEWVEPGEAIGPEEFLAAEAATGTRLRTGDLLFFRTSGTRISHVAIYAGEGRFVHAPKTGRPVELRMLDDEFYRPRLAGAGRLF